MSRRPRHLLLAATLSGALLLAGCSGSGSGASDTDPTVEGTYGQSATMTFSGDAAPSELTVETISEGDGEAVESTDFVLAHYVGQVWNGDVFDSSFEGGAPILFSLDRVIAGWKQGLEGVKVGSRVLISVPPELGYGPQGGNPQAGIGADDVIVFTVDVLGAYAPDQAGDPDATPTGNDLPVTIEGDLGAPATVKVDEGAEPPAEGPQTIVVAEGTGEPVGSVEDGTLMVIQYAASMWDGSATESTWEMNSPIAVTLGGTVFDELAGVPAGSRAVVLVPGQVDPASGQEGSAMAAVVDVLGSAHVDTSKAQTPQGQ